LTVFICNIKQNEFIVIFLLLYFHDGGTFLRRRLYAFVLQQVQKQPATGATGATGAEICNRCNRLQPVQ
jgi:hypothetical protein